MNLYKEARAIAEDAWKESQGDFDMAQDYIIQSCDGHEISIYFYHAMKAIADWNTDEGEQWLKDCGGIAQPGDSFGQIACRVAYATLYCAAMEWLSELEEKESE